MRWILMALAGTALLVVGTLSVSGQPSSAQDAQDTADSFIGRVAGKLGISEDKLSTAIKDSELEVLDEAVADGSLTQEQADRIRAHIEEYGGTLRGPFFGRGFGGPGFGHHHCRAVGFVVDAAAEVLGMTEDDLKAQLRDDKSLANVADAQGMSLDDFKSGLLKQIKAQLDQKVTDGDLTQERADGLYQKTQDNIDDIVNAKGKPHGFCLGDGRPPLDYDEDDSGKATGA